MIRILSTLKIFLLFTLIICSCNIIYAQDIPSILKEAQRLETSLNEKQALNKYQEVLKLDPLNFTSLIRCAELSSGIGAREESAILRDKYFDASINYAKLAYKCNPNSDEACVQMSIAYGRLALTKSGKEKVSSVREIKAYAEKAIKINPSNFKAWHVLGKWHYEVSNLNFLEKAAIKLFFGSLPQSTFNMSIEAYDKARKLHPTFILNYLELAKSYHKNNDHKKAISMLKSATSLPVKTEDDPRIKKEAAQLLKSWQ
jgi:tetratricopeptide (TPR) repeat protein